MSLVTNLRDEQLGQWCATALPGTPTLIDQVQAAARGRDPVRPVQYGVDSDHWAMIGGAFGQRLAFLVAHEAPYASYLGATKAGLLNPRLLGPMVDYWPTQHRSIDGSTSPNEPGIADDLIDLFTRNLIDFNLTAAGALPGQLANTRKEEMALLHRCNVLAGWEAAYRGNGLPRKLELLHQLIATTPDGESDTLTDSCVLAVDAIDEDQENELVALSGRLHGSGALEQFRALAGNPAPGVPLGVAQPLFVPHWADGDVMVGDTLIDVKTVITLKNRDRIAQWLWQILGYAWLDTGDRYRIRDVGLYLARHGVLITWPLEEFAATLVGSTGGVRSAQQGFLLHAYEAMAFEGATPFDPPQQTRTA